MARVLAIETSGRIGSIAIVEHDHVLSEEQFAHGLQHAAQIIPIIDRLCRQHGWKPADVEQLYVSAGPGSFTGLRIGITLTKTMALATGAKIVAVPTVRVLAENAPADAGHLIIVLDAKRDQIFTARFERAAVMSPSSGTPGEGRGGGLVERHQTEPSPTPLPEYRAREMSAWIEREPAHLDGLTAMLSHSPRPVHLLGEGIPYHEKFIPANDAQVIVTPADSWRARASSVAKIGMEMAQRGEFADPMQLTPIYIRRPEAEEKWDARK